MAKRTDLPDNISANAKKLCAESEKTPAKAVALLEEALEDSPSSRSVILKLADAYRQAESYGKAVKLLENACAGVVDIELKHQLANAYADRKWGKKAISQFNTCLDSDEIYPELIQDYAEFMLDSEEHKALIAKLTETAAKVSDPFDKDTAAMCIAMIYSAIGDCAANNIKTDIDADYLTSYLADYPAASDKVFFTKVIKYLSETPNSISIIPITDKLFRIIAGAVPSVTSDNKFLSAVADFEISLILFENDVTPLTALAMRTAKLKFAAPSDDKDYLRYLIFDAKMTIVDTLRKGSVDTDTFSKRYSYLWTLISDFVLGAVRTSDLRQYARIKIYEDLRNVSPRLMKIFEENLSADGFASLKKFISSPVNAAPSVPVRPSRKGIVSAKISPNSPCPCGSGKKYKKCCGLK